MTQFGRLTASGELVDVREIPQSAIAACPHVIFTADHYREDNSCRCDDPSDTEMAEWGYTWDAERGRWT